MNDCDDDRPLEAYMNDFGRALHAAAATPPRRSAARRRLPLLLAPAVAAGLALTAVLLLLPGGPATRRLDVVAEARAALQPQAGAITHLIYDSDIGTAAHDIPRVRTEQWSAAHPVRWRATWVQPADASHRHAVPVEISYADGTLREYHTRSNRLTVFRGLSGSEQPRIYPLGADPVATLRAMLAAGRVRDAGQTTIGGRAVRRLVGTRAGTFGRHHLVTTLEYDVDPTTFAPVRAKLELPAPSAAHPIYSILTFRAFERLPLDAETAKLLAVHPRPDAKVKSIRIKRR